MYVSSSKGVQKKCFAMCNTRTCVHVHVIYEIESVCKQVPLLRWHIPSSPTAPGGEADGGDVWPAARGAGPGGGGAEPVPGRPREARGGVRPREGGGETPAREGGEPGGGASRLMPPR